MKLKNYTSETPASRSIAKIEQLLVSVGARNINKQYNDDQQLVSFTFLILLNDQTLAFKLPAKVDPVYKVLWKDIKRPRADTEKRIRAQAERTAWKILSDWVEIQVAMIRLEQAELAEIFLPYHYNHELEKTLYQRVKSGTVKLLN